MIWAGTAASEDAATWALGLLLRPIAVDTLAGSLLAEDAGEFASVLAGACSGGSELCMDASAASGTQGNVAFLGEVCIGVSAASSPAWAVAVIVAVAGAGTGTGRGTGAFVCASAAANADAATIDDGRCPTTTTSELLLACSSLRERGTAFFLSGLTACTPTPTRKPASCMCGRCLACACFFVSSSALLRLLPPAAAPMMGVKGRRQPTEEDALCPRGGPTARCPADEA